MRFYIAVLMSAMSLAWVNAQADEPIVDLNDLPEETAFAVTAAKGNAVAPVLAADPMASRRSLPPEQRIRLLEQQIGNLTQMNLPAKIDSLEQQIHQLNGQIEEQAHIIQQLQSQPKQPSTAGGVDSSSNSGVAASPTLPISPAAKTPTQTENPVKKTPKAVAASTAAATNSVTSEEAAPNNSPIAMAETAVVQNKAVASAAGNATKGGGSAESAYQAALDLMIKKQNTAATKAFQVFLKNYPSATYVPSAHYWLGELYSGNNKTALASKEFTTVIKQYPTHPKVADAMLKLAIIHDDAGQHVQAKQELQKVVQQFPDSSAAKLAKMRLKGMK